MEKKWIDADELKEWADIVPLTPDGGIDANDLAKKIESMPAADVVPVRHGKWLKEKCRGLAYKCSACGNCLDFRGVNAGRGDANFCPHCGAQMELYNGAIGWMSK